ncbi:MULTISPECIES: lipoyl(octanoyl) transferase LipB [Parafrankia]|uniref:Octanoyltransferase n=1 Tax=Parafrankia soli TaxID=2599596 RepID=A0A1S1PV53_9ACTN|nr:MULTISPECIES: lipoyl(octanoyl) transferase LipB [Parafrankia]OHV25131.1 lipoate-protein ligase B [Parafrankia soli]TCJ33571.1 lipoyl(octanoyl) transferase LipB [Parafrankia sp. BMG5.11]CAI7978231.1 lipoyl(octanoyl) transferase [Frankia sp. Hr75.2]SQD95245.1 Octanoyltransferase [Parafrankia sp. Ea1.12]
MWPCCPGPRAYARDVDVLRLGVVPYREAWEMQRTLADDRRHGRGSDTLILLEHPDVYTAGRRTGAGDRPVDGTEVVDVDRGGGITWHGPGQLVGYPIVRLPMPLDVVAYVRALEAGLMAACAEFGLETRRVEGRTGVWTSDGLRKLAAIGVRVSWKVTNHGFALNCDPALAAFGRIVPCGISDAGVTSLSRELGRPLPVAEARPVVERHMLTALADYLATGLAAEAGRRPAGAEDSTGKVAGTDTAGTAGRAATAGTSDTDLIGAGLAGGKVHR